jgi:hypothetical protein
MDQEPRYWSGSFLSTSKISRNNLDFYYLVTFFDFLSLKSDEIVLLKDYKQKNSEKTLTFRCHLSATDKKALSGKGAEFFNIK